MRTHPHVSTTPLLLSHVYAASRLYVPLMAHTTKWYVGGKGQCWGEAGDGARELLPWTANPGTHKHFDPEHPLAWDSKGTSILPWLIGAFEVRIT